MDRVAAVPQSPHRNSKNNSGTGIKGMFWLPNGTHVTVESRRIQLHRLVQFDVAIPVSQYMTCD
jgi:hypothetical protein